MEAHTSADAPAPRPGEAPRARRQVAAVFLALVAMTGVELAVARAPAGRAAVMAGLAGLAVAKAALVGLFFMHLRHETPVLRWTVFGPLLAPALYGLVLAADAAWRAAP